MADDPRETFRLEAQELLTRLEEALMDLEDTPTEQNLIDAAFRALHTIKGSGGMFGYDDVVAFAHHFETVFDRVRKGEVPITRQILHLSLAAKDHLYQQILAPEQADPAEARQILADLDASAGTATEAEGETPSGVSAEASAGMRRRWHLKFTLPADSLINGTNPLLLLDELRELGPCVVRADTALVPPLAAMDPETLYLAWDVELETEQPRTAIEAVFMFVIDVMTLSLEETILVPANDSDSNAVPPAHSPLAPVSPSSMVATVSSMPRANEAPRKEINSRMTATDNIRIPAERIDALMDQVGELVIAQSRLKQLVHNSADLNVRSIAEEIERLTSELRDITMGIRMVPIGQLFGRFRRVVRDLSRDLGKEVELATWGEETELDKTMIESLNDPLVHLIRNAIDHGLETAAERREAGKEPVGLLELFASHAGTKVIIGLRDDGRGMDRARIRAKAEAMGMLEPGQVIADGDLLGLVLEPGFSTRQEVSNLSGRGVGMDVVKKAVEALRGDVEITSVPGTATQILLQLPLTLAIVDGLLVRVGQGRYVIPLSNVEECAELSPEDDARSTGRDILSIRGDLVPFIRLRDTFAASGERSPYPKVVVVSDGESRVGLVVDQVIGDHQTVIKSLSRLHADVTFFSGATILGDGSVALIIDVAQITKRASADIANSGITLAS